ncbi:Chondroitin sulfate proteoglycan 4 [Heterocephalus glaber]|uniref:Chondroitin sulfate proteoglycan 4 n=1 Tax=Heterocephalus glaber TaxID=10181 RepID=G5AR74_HETGA|nr:Chondroitin sulfate proteoglycan 4 [Heterocephalus glaber]
MRRHISKAQTQTSTPQKANFEGNEVEKSDNQPPGHLELIAQEVTKQMNEAVGKFKGEIISQITTEMGATVKEGDKVLIDQSKLDASNLLFKLPKSQHSSYEVWFQVTSLPHHGTIMVGERNITKEKPNFSQYIINKFGVTYLHDDSDSLADSFTFAVWPNKKSKSATKPEAGFLEELFNITTTPGSPAE